MLLAKSRSRALSGSSPIKFQSIHRARGGRAAEGTNKENTVPLWGRAALLIVNRYLCFSTFGNYYVKPKKVFDNRTKHITLLPKSAKIDFILKSRYKGFPRPPREGRDFAACAYWSAPRPHIHWLKNGGVLRGSGRGGLTIISTNNG
jgi:hypothetical protein